MTVRILMVDDEPDAQELFRQNFRKEIRNSTYAFEFAMSGEEALNVLNGQQPPEVVMVLSDINMPGMTGLELLAEVREKWSEVSVLMVTAYGDEATETRARDLGAESFLTKPIDFERLKRDLPLLLGEGT